MIPTNHAANIIRDATSYRMAHRNSSFEQMAREWIAAGRRIADADMLRDFLARNGIRFPSDSEQQR